MASIQTIQPDDLITDSRADINQNFANLNNDKIETSALDTDTTLSANSDTKIPSQKAIKAYVDAGGAPNFPSDYVTTSAGAGDAGKGVKLNASGVFDASFTRPPTVQVFTSSGTYTAPSGLKYAIVEVVGGGGGGGSALTVSGSASGGGGGGGGYAKKLISATTIGVSQTVTIGALGAGGAPSNAGSAGGNTTFGALLTANGGSGGSHESSGGAGGTASDGDINITGQTGGEGGDATLGTRYGGSSFYGFGGAPTSANGSNAGVGYGAGGSGASDGSDGGGDSGGNGTAGICIVTEYYN